MVQPTYNNENEFFTPSELTRIRYEHYSTRLRQGVTLLEISSALWFYGTWNAAMQSIVMRDNLMFTGWKNVHNHQEFCHGMANLWHGYEDIDPSLGFVSESEWKRINRHNQRVLIKHQIMCDLCLEAWSRCECLPF